MRHTARDVAIELRGRDPTWPVMAAAEGADLMAAMRGCSWRSSIGTTAVPGAAAAVEAEELIAERWIVIAGKGRSQSLRRRMRLAEHGQGNGAQAAEARGLRP
jgi:GrpB-like predicted nucleotidyltransferase (UPF0157 family)